MSGTRTSVRNSARAALLSVIVIAIVVIVLLGLAFAALYIPGYNRAIQLDRNVNRAWADVDAQLQRRLDLIPNLVETVRGYATQEKGIFENIAQARTKYFQADTIAGKIEASNDLSGFLSRLLFLQERYPELKSSQNFRDLQVALEGTENRIAVARTRYNEAVGELDNYARSFFGSFFARRAGVKLRPYFEATEAARAAPPKVDFSPKPAPPPAQPPAPAPTAPAPGGP
jgi:LemA protein